MFECEAIITGNREIVPGVFLMVLDAPSIAAAAEPGRFVMIRVGLGLDPLLRRPLSICGLYEEGAFGVLYKVVGRGTAFLAEKRPGNSVHVLGPLGNGFSYSNCSSPLLLVGGGMGVAPLFFLAQSLFRRGDRSFHLMTGFSGREQTLSTADVLGLNVTAHIATDDGSMGHAGPVTDLLQAVLQNSRGKDAPGGVLACGPTAMLRKVALLADAAQVPCHVSLEAYMACGLGACLGCVVHAAPLNPSPFLRVCTEGPVFPADALDWNRVGPQ